MSNKNILNHRDAPIYICFAIWLFINFACMAIPSPYCSTVKYTYIWIFALCLNILFWRFGDIRRVQSMMSIFWALHLVFILYLILFTKPVRGSHRWLMIGSMSYQPSEGLKIFFIPVFANLLMSKAYMPAVIVFALSLLVLLMQPDIGNATMLILVTILMLKHYGIETKKIALTLVPIGFVFAIHFSHARKRIMDFVKQESYQNVRAIGAIKNGGLFGTGLGNGKIKAILPDAYSDFVFAVICEELGLIGCLAVCLSFLVFTLHVLNVCRFSKISRASMSVLGLGCLIGIQAWIHIGSVTWIIPTKGTTLPFISHGGTSIVLMNIAFGLILGNIASVRRRKVFTENHLIGDKG